VTEKKEIAKDEEENSTANLFENYHSAQMRPADQVIAEFKSRLANRLSIYNPPTASGLLDED
jgi:hypothetical protein